MSCRYSKLITHNSLLITQNFLVDRDFSQKIEVAQHFSRPQDDARERVFGERHWQSCLLPDSLVQIFDERSTTRKDDSAISDVGREFWWRALQNNADGIDDNVDAFVQRLPNFFIRNHNAFRYAFHQVPAFNLDCAGLVQNIC